MHWVFQRMYTLKYLHSFIIIIIITTVIIMHAFQSSTSSEFRNQAEIKSKNCASHFGEQTEVKIVLVTA